MSLTITPRTATLSETLTSTFGVLTNATQAVNTALDTTNYALTGLSHHARAYEQKALIDAEISADVHATKAAIKSQRDILKLEQEVAELIGNDKEAAKSFDANVAKLKALVGR